MSRLGRARPARSYGRARPASPIGTMSGSLAMAPRAISGTADINSPASGSLAMAARAISGTASWGYLFPVRPLPAKIEILINGVWTDITSYVYQRQATVITRARPDESQSITPSQATLTLNNRDGRFSPKNSGGAYYPYITRNVQLRISINNVLSSSGDTYTGYRFWGEVSEWPPQWDPSATDIYVNITASGILRRYQQSKKFQSALKFYWTTLASGSDPLVYYSMEDSGPINASIGAAFSADYTASRVQNPANLSAMVLVSGTLSYASSTAFAGSNPLPFINGAQTATEIIQLSTLSQTSMVFLLDIPSSGGTDGMIIARFFPNYASSSGLAQVNLVYHTGGKFELFGYDHLSSQLFDSGLLSVNADGTPMVVSITVTTTTVTLKTILPGLFQTATTQYTVSQATSFNNTFGYWISGSNFISAGSTASGHCAIMDSAPDLPSIAAAASGYAGEPALNRFDRLCAQAGISTPSRTDYSGVINGYSPATWWKLSDVAGTAYVLNSVTSHHDTNNSVTFGNASSPVMNVSGGSDVIASCALFNGSSSSAVSVYNPSGLSAITVMAWVNLNTDGHGLGTTDAHIIANSNTVSDNKGISLLLSGGATPKIAFGTGSAFGSVTSANALSPYGWHFLAATWNGTTITLYVNGQSVGTASFSGTLAAGTDNVSLGYNPVVNGDYFAGLMSQAAIIPSVLTAAQIQSLWLLQAGALMGGQGSDTLVNLLQAVENLDRGQLYETRGMFGLDYLTRVQLQHQSVAATFNYSAAQLAQSLAPVTDDQLSRNDVTLTQSGGTTVTVALTSGTMSDQNPPNGIGDYAYSATVLAYSGLQLINCATWIMTVGTVDEYRYPVVKIDLARSEAASLFSATANLDVGGFFEIINPPSFVNSATVKQLAWGFTETLGPFGIWTIAINGVPESPYEGSNLPTW